jgi:hypothetical protein
VFPNHAFSLVTDRIFAPTAPFVSVVGRMNPREKALE